MAWYVMREKDKVITAILGGFASRKEAEVAEERLCALVGSLYISERIPEEILGGKCYLEKRETEEETKLQMLFLKRRWEECAPIIIDLYTQPSSQ